MDKSCSTADALRLLLQSADVSDLRCFETSCTRQFPKIMHLSTSLSRKFREKASPAHAEMTEAYL